MREYVFADEAGNFDFSDKSGASQFFILTTVIAAQIGTKKRRKAMRLAIADVVDQTTRCKWEVAFWPAESDPCLQVADYCCWAIQRKYEQSDTRSYDLIKDKIKSEFRPYDVGTET